MLNWGLVGLGNLADMLAPAFAASTNARLIACTSRTLERSEAYAKLHNVDRAYESYHELLRDPRVDAVYVATPNHLHYPVVLAAAAAGKHVLCEKPMAPTVREAQEMVSACEKAGVTLRIGFHLRFMKVVQSAAAAVHEGRLGSIREATAQRVSGQRMDALATWRQDLTLANAGVLADVGVHVIDLVQWVVGDRISRVFALAYPPRSSGRPDETVTVLLDFEGGCQATVRCSRGLPLGANDLQIFGTGGMLTAGPLRWVDTHRLVVRSRSESEEMEFPAEDLYRLELDAFAEEVAGNRTAAATGEDGVRAVRLAEAVIQSFESGTAVTVEE